MTSRVCTDAEYTTKVPIINSCYVLHATRTTDITRHGGSGGIIAGNTTQEAERKFSIFHLVIYIKRKQFRGSMTASFSIKRVNFLHEVGLRYLMTVGKTSHV